MIHNISLHKINIISKKTGYDEIHFSTHKPVSSGDTIRIIEKDLRVKVVTCWRVPDATFPQRALVKGEDIEAFRDALAYHMKTGGE